MNAHSSVVAEASVLTPAEAVAQANRWCGTARPILDAMLAVTAAEALLPAANDGTAREARTAIADAAARLRALAEDIRQDAIAGALPSIPAPRASQFAWDNWGDIDEALLTGVTPLETAIRRRERELDRG